MNINENIKNMDEGIVFFCLNKNKMKLSLKKISFFNKDEIARTFIQGPRPGQSLNSPFQPSSKK